MWFEAWQLKKIQMPRGGTTSAAEQSHHQRIRLTSADRLRKIFASCAASISGWPTKKVVNLSVVAYGVVRYGRLGARNIKQKWPPAKAAIDSKYGGRPCRT